MRIFAVSAACAAALIAILTSTAAAQDEEESSGPWSISGTIVGTSDYMFRGVSQTQNDAAIQGSIDLSHESGFYAGVWASNVDFGPFDAAGTSIELDIYAGWSGSSEDELFSYDFNVTWFTYPDAETEDNGLPTYSYFEGYAQLGYDFGQFAISGAVSFTPEYFGETGTGLYLTAGIAVPITDWLTIDANIGHQNIEDAAPDSYMDWNAGATASIEDHFEVDIRYTDTTLSDIECASFTGSIENVCDGRVVFSVSATLP